MTANDSVKRQYRSGLLAPGARHHSLRQRLGARPFRRPVPPQRLALHQAPEPGPTRTAVRAHRKASGTQA